MRKNGKRIFSLILSVVLCLTTFLSVMPVGAKTEKEPGSRLTHSFDKSTGVLTISGTGEMFDFGDGSITSKQPPWLDYKPDIKKVVIENGVTSVGKYAFYNCENLTSVSLPESVTTINGGGVTGGAAGTNGLSFGAFRDCKKLTEINFPSKLQSIGIAAFRGCTSLKKVVLPDSVTSLGAGAFVGCEGLTEVTIGAGLTELSIECFYNCTKLAKVDWGPSLKKVSEWSFFNTYFKEISFPEQITEIGARAFANCYFLTNAYFYNRNCKISEVLSLGVTGTVGNPFDNAGIKGNQKFTVHGYPGSTAETFAKEKKYEFASLDTCKHEHTHINVKKPATCTEAGLQDVYCDDCNTVINPDVAIPATGHDFEIISTSDDTAVDGHIRQYEKCRTCNYEDVKLTHVEAEDSGTIKKYIWVDGKYTYTNTATCTVPGVETYTCTVDGCGVVQRNAVKKAGHKVENWTVTKEPNCVEEGSRTGHCSVCDKDVTEAIAKTGHTLDTQNPVKVEDKTETDGHIYSTYACSVCGEQVVQTNHTAWVEGQYTPNVLAKPTCTTDGYRRDKCDICGETRTITLPSNGGHTWEVTEQVEPTCTTKGQTNYKCSVCDATKKDSEVPALGHSYVVQKELTVNPTCTEAGSQTFKCSRCSASKTDVLPATGHSPDIMNNEIIKNADCENAGAGHTTCFVCGVEYDYVIEPLGHKFENIETPIADKPGHVLSTPTCTRCGQKQTASVVHKEWVKGYYNHRVISEATCLVGEIFVDTCTICNQTTGNTQGAPLGHEFQLVRLYEEPTELAVNDKLKVEPFSAIYSCKHCHMMEAKNGKALFEMWDRGYYNTAPSERTAVDYSTYLDVNNDGIINAKDYAIMYFLSKDYEQYKAEQAQNPEQTDQNAGDSTNN